MQIINPHFSQPLFVGFVKLVSRIVFLFLLASILSAPALRAQSAQSDEASPWAVPVKMVSIIKEDDQGLPLKFPSFVFFDKTMDEIYVVSGGNGRINLYGADYFPRISIGAGRGVDAPNGIYVAADGRLYICQGPTAKNPPRLTVLNAAFFPLQEILLQKFPEADSFVPSRVSVGRNGAIYIAGINSRGVMVLDSEGNFSHWLKPQDKIWAEEEKDDYSKLPKESGDGADAPKENGEIAEEDQQETELANLPDFLRPKKKTKLADEESKLFGPVQVTDVVCGAEGYVYLLSEETSKVYVYNPAEELLFSFGKKGGSSGKMSRPRGLAVDEKKKCIYVVDYMRHTILVYNFAGRFLFEIGGKGSAPLWFNFPTALALNRQGNMVVADLFNQRVQVLDVRFEAGFSLFGPSNKSDEENKEENKPTGEGKE